MLIIPARIMAPRRLGAPEWGNGLFTDVLGDYFYLALLLAAAIHVVDVFHPICIGPTYHVFVLALAAIELVSLAVFGAHPDEIVAISTVENVRTLDFLKRVTAPAPP